MLYQKFVLLHNSILQLQMDVSADHQICQINVIHNGHEMEEKDKTVNKIGWVSDLHKEKIDMIKAVM